MCYPDRSLEQATSICSMCKVFPRNNSCPHKENMGVCKNRANHPRHDVVHFRNAELSSFNGCGFCKWAKRHPKAIAAEAAWKNPGWPGCCRSPRPSEYEYINNADWYAISKIHGVPVPATTTPGGSPPSSHIPPNKSPSNSPRSHSIATPRTPERRDSGSREAGSPYSSGSSVGRDPVVASLTPKGDSDVRRRSNSDISRKPDVLAPVRAPVVTREPPINVSRSPTRLPNPASPRKDNEREPDRGKVPSDEKERDKERRIATKTYTNDSTCSTLRISQHLDVQPPRPSNPAVPRSSASSSSGSSSSGSQSSITQSGTVTSEGFTDYLSDESEVEMQREAERRAGEAELAAKLERTKFELGKEEQEFRAARTQLVSVGLQPPPAWSSGRMQTTAGKAPGARSAQTTFSASSEASRSPGNIYGSHSTPAASYVQVYSVARQ